MQNTYSSYIYTVYSCGNVLNQPILFGAILDFQTLVFQKKIAFENVIIEKRYTSFRLLLRTV